MLPRFLIVAIFGLACLPTLAANASNPEWVDAIEELAATSFPKKITAGIRDQTWRNLRDRGAAANRNDVASWRSIKTKQDWQRFSAERLKRLRTALGDFPETKVDLKTRITKTTKGSGFVVENIVFQSRPDFWVTANLYGPEKPTEKMPAILIAHSHHRPKTQGELQDMGMIWARAGCVVLVIDQVGHGERASHPFQSEDSYQKEGAGFRWWRQDYYFRFNSNTQLHLAGDSLMGWMAYDLMRGVDLLVSRPSVDPKRILLLGAVAGGGDPAGVVAALDDRIAAAVPFNFGGPQPETRYPLPKDADLHFNYLGGAYWEGTRNLRRTGADGFFHWVIVGSIAPRKLIYAHEFAWDREHDPVWKRLNQIYEFYAAADNIDYTHGAGSVKGKAPESTHCTNIGKHHRRRIHVAFKRWFDISVEDDFSDRLTGGTLQSMTPTARRELQPLALHEAVSRKVQRQLTAAREQRTGLTQARRRAQTQKEWRRVLGDIDPRDGQKVVFRSKKFVADESLIVEQIALQTEEDIVLPMTILTPTEKTKEETSIVIAVAQAGRQAFLKNRSTEISELLAQGKIVCLADVRDAGFNRGDLGAGPNGSISHYALFFETPMLGYRLRDLRAIMKYLRTRKDFPREFAIWGDSFAKPNPAKAELLLPKRVNNRPDFSEPLGGLLAMLAGLYEVDVHAIYVRGGLSNFESVVKSPYVLVPHDVIVPELLETSDIPDLAAALAPASVRLEALVNNGNQLLTEREIETDYTAAITAYQKSTGALTISESVTSPAKWLGDEHAD